jgi:hypothetical protein
MISLQEVVRGENGRALHYEHLVVRSGSYKHRSAHSGIRKLQIQVFSRESFQENPIGQTQDIHNKGPRQIGKTTFLKLYIRKPLKDGVKPSNIFHVRCGER